jgi:hypothetical protein
VLLLLGAAFIGRRSPQKLKGAESLAALILLVVGFIARWEVLDAKLLAAAPLSADAQTVRAIAESMTHPYATGIREPLWVWLLWVSHAVFGPTALAGRMFSLSTYMLLLVVSYLLARRYPLGALPSLAVLGLLSVHPSLIQLSAEAHRTELYAAALVAVAMFAFSSGMTATTRVVGLAATSGLIALTQLVGVIAAWTATLWAWGLRRISLAGVLLTMAATIVVVAPYGMYTSRVYGQAFYFTRTLVPTFYRNHEFVLVKRTGCEGCPTLEQVVGNGYAGPPASMAEYLFRYHSVSEVLRRSVNGYALVFLPGPLLAMIIGWDAPILYGLYFVGVGVALATRARELVLIPFVSLNLLAFVVPVGIDPRLVLHIAPFAVFLVVLGGRAAARAGLGLWRRPFTRGSVLSDADR